LTPAPATSVFDIKDIKPEALHAVIKTTALLLNLGDTLALASPVPFELSEKLRLLWCYYKPQYGVMLLVYA
jgi:hypothetical protein